jgi:hypothetical protein
MSRVICAGCAVRKYEAKIANCVIAEVVVEIFSDFVGIETGLHVGIPHVDNVNTCGVCPACFAEFLHQPPVMICIFNITKPIFL